MIGEGLLEKFHNSVWNFSSYSLLISYLAERKGNQPVKVFIHQYNIFSCEDATRPNQYHSDHEVTGQSN